MSSNLKEKLPDLYSEISETLESAKLILSEAVPNAQTLFHTPVVSSVHENKIVSRVMVLREFNFDKKILRFHTDNRAAKIENLIKQLSLWEKRNTKIMELSGGMKRRVLIAKALSHEPQIL